MWKFKKRKKSLEERTVPTAIIERQSVDVDGDGDGDKQNNENYDYNDKQRDDDLDDYSNKIDVLLAKELNALSFQQRETINEEIHGINVDQVYDRGKEIEETPELLKESFGKLQTELNHLQPDSFAFHRCQQLYGDDDNIALYHGGLGNAKRRRTYINTDNLRMMFLRCELFDITKAARRLVDFVELMYDMYGDIGLQSRIQLDDMSEEERRILKAGYTQILPGRDRAGRRIAINIANSTNEYTEKSRIRILLYLSQQFFVDDIETQRKGAIIIQWYYNVNIFHGLSTKKKGFSAFSKAVPIRVGAMHIVLCILDTDSDELEHNYTNKSPVTTINEYSSLDSNSITKGVTSSQSTAISVNIIKSMVALSIGAKNRSKLRIHTGSTMECLYALQSFGIQSNQIPIVTGINSNKKRTRRNKVKTNNGTLKLKNHTKWLQLCQLKESNIKLCGKEWKYYGGYDQQQIIECPNHSDVLSGRGMGTMHQPGNAVLRSIVTSKLDEYVKLKSNEEKTKFTLDVVYLLKNQYGARFLKEETTESNGKLGCWIEASDEAARIKVRISFRDKNKVQQLQKPHEPTPTAATTTMITTTTTNNYNTPNNDNNNQQILQYQQVDKEDSNSSTSMFLSMAGRNDGCSGCGCGGTITGKKSKLQK